MPKPVLTEEQQQLKKEKIKATKEKTKANKEKLEEEKLNNPELYKQRLVDKATEAANAVEKIKVNLKKAIAKAEKAAKEAEEFDPEADNVEEKPKKQTRKKKTE